MFKNDPVNTFIIPLITNPIPINFIASPSPSEAIRVSDIAIDSGYISFPCSSTIKYLYTNDKHPIPNRTPPTPTANPSKNVILLPIKIIEGNT